MKKTVIIVDKMSNRLIHQYEINIDEFDDAKTSALLIKEACRLAVKDRRIKENDLSNYEFLII